MLAALPDNQRAKSLLALAMPTLDCLATMTQHATESQQAERKNELSVVLDRISAEVIVITTMARAFTDAFTENDISMGSGCRTSDGHAALVEPALALIKRAWPSIAKAASSFNNHYVSNYATLFLHYLLHMNLIILSMYLCFGSLYLNH